MSRLTDEQPDESRRAADRVEAALRRVYEHESDALASAAAQFHVRAKQTTLDDPYDSGRRWAWVMMTSYLDARLDGVKVREAVSHALEEFIEIEHSGS